MTQTVEALRENLEEEVQVYRQLGASIDQATVELRQREGRIGLLQEQLKGAEEAEAATEPSQEGETDQ